VHGKIRAQQGKCARKKLERSRVSEKKAQQGTEYRVSAQKNKGTAG